MVGARGLDLNFGVKRFTQGGKGGVFGLKFVGREKMGVSGPRDFDFHGICTGGKMKLFGDLSSVLYPRVLSDGNRVDLASFRLSSRITEAGQTGSPMVTFAAIIGEESAKNITGLKAGAFQWGNVPSDKDPNKGLHPVDLPGFINGMTIEVPNSPFSFSRLMVLRLLFEHADGTQSMLDLATASEQLKKVAEHFNSYMGVD